MTNNQAAEAMPTGACDCGCADGVTFDNVLHGADAALRHMFLNDYHGACAEHQALVEDRLDDNEWLSLVALEIAKNEGASDLDDAIGDVLDDFEWMLDLREAGARPFEVATTVITKRNNPNGLPLAHTTFTGPPGSGKSTVMTQFVDDAGADVFRTHIDLPSLSTVALKQVIQTACDRSRSGKASLLAFDEIDAASVSTFVKKAAQNEIARLLRDIRTGTEPSNVTVFLAYDDFNNLTPALRAEVKGRFMSVVTGR